MAKQSINLAGLLYGAEVGRKCCALVNFDWANFNGTFEEFCDLMYEPTKKRIGDTEVTRDKSQMNEILEQTYINVQWLRFKKVYDFHPTFVQYLQETENGKVSLELLKRLPFKCFYIPLNNIEFSDIYFMDGTEKRGWAKGLIVDVVVKDGIAWFSLELLYLTDLKYENNGAEWILTSQVVRLADGESFEYATDYRRLRNDEKEKLLKEFSEQDLNAARDFWLPFLRIVLNSCNYICSANAEIKDVKIPKNKRPKSNVAGRKNGIAIQTSKVGYRIGEKFERMYKDYDAVNGKTGIKGIKKRPHVRRAHWHHYWTGPGRTVLEVRWLEPVFVMGDEEQIDTVVHEVKGEST